MLIHVVAGARPNFMKAAPLCWAAEELGVELRLIHTGQHYDKEMSQVFFDELGLPKPHKHLGVGSGTHGQVTARCLERLEEVFAQERPDWVLVVGDVNSTAAGALAAVKLHIATAHVEAGLRSFDRSMPEEINRMVTDAICDLLFVSEPAGVENLRREGHGENEIHLVGNVMIDTLERFLPAAKKRASSKKLGLEPKQYALLTLHRPSNVDSSGDLAALVEKLDWVQNKIPIFFPVHPRTRAKLKQTGHYEALSEMKNLQLADPVGYQDFLSLMTDSRVVLTDSGGIQEETTVLGIPCLTLRDNTERPITCDHGTNRLVGARGDGLASALEQVLDAPVTTGKRPDLWDGKAAVRIMKQLLAAS